MRCEVKIHFSPSVSNCLSTSVENALSSIKLLEHLHQKTVDHTSVGLFPVTLSHWSMHMPVPHSLDYYSYIINPEIDRTVSSNIIFFEIVLAILIPWTFIMNFRVFLSVSTKNHAEILIGIILSLFNNLGGIDIITILSFPIH